jgi:hypothetical protein
MNIYYRFKRPVLRRLLEPGLRAVFGVHHGVLLATVSSPDRHLLCVDDELCTCKRSSKTTAPVMVF